MCEACTERCIGSVTNDIWVTGCNTDSKVFSVLGAAMKQLVRFPSPPKQGRCLSLFEMSRCYGTEPGEAFLGKKKSKIFLPL